MYEQASFCGRLATSKHLVDFENWLLGLEDRTAESQAWEKEKTQEVAHVDVYDENGMIAVKFLNLLICPESQTAVGGGRSPFLSSIMSMRNKPLWLLAGGTPKLKLKTHDAPTEMPNFPQLLRTTDEMPQASLPRTIMMPLSCELGEAASPKLPK